jgi:chromosome segregation ATPase
MAQESYADFSIIQKYIDQKKIFDQEIAEKNDQINEVKSQVQKLQLELQKKNQLIAQLREKLDDFLTQVQEKDKKIQSLEQHNKRLSQQISQLQASPASNPAAANAEDTKRGIFGFGKK